MIPLQKPLLGHVVTKAVTQVVTRIVIRVDASLTIGTGHVMRCLTLANALAQAGSEVVFICREHDGHLIQHIKTAGFCVYTLPHITTCDLRAGDLQPTLFHANWLGVSQQQDAQDCLAILAHIQPDWLMVDHYAIDQAWQSALKPYYKKLMVIDDLGDRHHDCDVLLDQNYGSTAAKYQELVPKECKILAGTRYALLRPEFAQWRSYSLKRRVPVQGINRLLITLGGVDSDNITQKILQQLAQSQLSATLDIVVVMGITAPHLDAVKAQAQKMPFNTQVKTNVSNMAELMADADLAIGAAGATTWERCCLGLPTIQLVIAQNQRHIAQALVKDNMIVLMEHVEELPGLVSNALSWINTLSKNSQTLTDGLGCNRVLLNLCRTG